MSLALVEHPKTFVIPVSNRRVESSNTSSETPENFSTGSPKQLAESINLTNRGQINDFLSQDGGREFAELPLEKKIQFFILKNKLANIDLDPDIMTLRAQQLFIQKNVPVESDQNSTIPDLDEAVEKKRQALIDAFKQTLDKNKKIPNIYIENFSSSRNLQSLFKQFLIDDSDSTNRQVKISKKTLELYLKHKSFRTLRTSAEELEEMRDSLKGDLLKQGFPEGVLDMIIKKSGDQEFGDQEFIALVVQSFSSRLIDFEGMFISSMNPDNQDDQNKILGELERFTKNGSTETENSVFSDGDEPPSISVRPGNAGGDTKLAAKAPTRAEPSSNDTPDLEATQITSSSIHNPDPNLIAFLRDYFAEREKGTKPDLEAYMQKRYQESDEELTREDWGVISRLNDRFKNYSSILSFAGAQTTSTSNTVFPRISREEMAGIYKSVKSHQREKYALEQEIIDNVVKYSRLTNSIITGLLNRQPINIPDLYAEAHEKPFQDHIAYYLQEVNFSSLLEDAVHYLRTTQGVTKEDMIFAIFDHQLKQTNLSLEQRKKAIKILETLMDPNATVEQLRKLIRQNKIGNGFLAFAAACALTLATLAYKYNDELDVQQYINTVLGNQIQNSNNVNDIVNNSRATTIESLRRIYSENESSNFTALDSSKEQPLNTIKYFLNFVDFTKKSNYAQYFSPENFNKKDLVVFFPVNQTLEKTPTGPIRDEESKYYRDIEENYKPIFDGLPPELQEHFKNYQDEYENHQRLYKDFFDARGKAMSQYKSALGMNIQPSNYIFPFRITLNGEIRTVHVVDVTPPNNGEFDLTDPPPDLISSIMHFLAHDLSSRFPNETDIPINQKHIQVANRNILQEVKDKLRNSGRLQSGRQITNSDSF